MSQVDGVSALATAGYWPAVCIWLLHSFALPGLNVQSDRRKTACLIEPLQWCAIRCTCMLTDMLFLILAKPSMSCLKV